jgi:hypothetical protein
MFFPRKISRAEIILTSFIAVYFFAVTVLSQDKYPQTKNIIAIVPLLMTFAGRAMSSISNVGYLPRVIKHVLFSLIFVYSLAYSIKGDMFFVNGDTRYQSTRWIYENIPVGSKVELFDQLNYVASDEIMKDYEIIYLGRNSRQFKGKHFFKWNTVEGREEYLKQINKYDSISDYIIVDLIDLEDFLSSDNESHIPGLNEYLRSLFTNKKNYRLVKVFEPSNRKVKRGNGLVYFENVWWDPVPSYRVTANTIYIFKRIQNDTEITDRS